jgi:hypothetical protein
MGTIKFLTINVKIIIQTVVYIRADQLRTHQLGRQQIVKYGTFSYPGCQRFSGS